MLACLPLVLTTLFLHQIPLAETYGLAVKTMTTAFIGFATALRPVVVGGLFKVGVPFMMIVD